jgi:hypothetical protein
MSFTQNIFHVILSNNLLERFQKTYDANQLKVMYQLSDKEASELYYFIQQTQRDPSFADSYR